MGTERVKPKKKDALKMAIFSFAGADRCTIITATLSHASLPHYVQYHNHMYQNVLLSFQLYYVLFYVNKTRMKTLYKIYLKKARK